MPNRKVARKVERWHGEHPGQPIVDYMASVGVRELLEYLHECHQGHGEDNQWHESLYLRISVNLGMNQSVVARHLKQGQELGLIEKKYAEWCGKPPHYGRCGFKGYALTGKGERALEIIRSLDRL